MNLFLLIQVFSVASIFFCFVIGIFAFKSSIESRKARDFGFEEKAKRKALIAQILATISLITWIFMYVIILGLENHSIYMRYAVHFQGPVNDNYTFI